MKKYFYIFIKVILLVSIINTQEVDSNIEFERTVSAISAIDFLTTDNIDIHKMILNYQPQIEYALVWRVRAVNTYKALREKEVFKASDINYLNYSFDSIA